MGLAVAAGINVEKYKFGRGVEVQPLYNDEDISLELSKAYGLSKVEQVHLLIAGDEARGRLDPWSGQSADYRGAWDKSAIIKVLLTRVDELEAAGADHD